MARGSGKAVIRGLLITLAALLLTLAAGPLPGGGTTPAHAASKDDAVTGKATRPGKPRKLAVSKRWTTAVRLRWARPRGRRPVSYVVYAGRKRKASTRRTSVRVRGLRCGKRYRFRVVAVARSGRRSARASTTRRTARCARRGRLGPVARAAADTTAPVVSLTTPLDGSASGDPVAWLGGLTGGLAGDSALITVRIYSGSGVSGSLAQSITTPRVSGNWFLTQSVALAAGTYTARAEQDDAAGNVGYSNTVTFTVGGRRVGYDCAGGVAECSAFFVVGYDADVLRYGGDAQPVTPRR